MSGRIPALEAARGVAAFMVVAVHVNTFHARDGVAQEGWLHFTSYGWIGVNVFFVLSGLVLYLPYARGKHLALGDYAAARLLRIVPGLWVALAVSGLVTGIWSSAALRHALFVNPLAQPGMSPDPPAWSLTVEMGFYLLLPALIVVFARRPAYRIPILVALVATGILARHAEGHGLARTPVTFVDYFAFGVLAAILVARVGTLPRRWLLAAAGSLAVAFAVSGVAPDWGYRNGTGAWFAITLAILALVDLRVPRTFVWIGTISYGIYLWHWPILEVAGDHGLYRLPDALEPIVIGLASVLLGWASWRLVEAPALALRKRRRGHRAPSSRPEAPQAHVGVAADATRS